MQNPPTPAAGSGHPTHTAGSSSLPQVPRLSAREIAIQASTLVWEFDRTIRRLPQGERDFFAGRRNALQVLLQRCGVLPTGPVGRSVEELLGGLSVIRQALPEGFEAFTAAQVYEFLIAHGIETSLDEVAGLHLYLTAGLKRKDVPAAPAVELDQDALAVAADAQDGADPHAGTVSQAAGEWLSGKLFTPGIKETAASKLQADEQARRDRLAQLPAGTCLQCEGLGVLESALHSTPCPDCNGTGRAA